MVFPIANISRDLNDKGWIHLECARIARLIPHRKEPLRSSQPWRSASGSVMSIGEIAIQSSMTGYYGVRKRFATPFISCQARQF